MKKRSLSLFLALLMVFGSVLPVFATEPVTATTEAAGEEQTPTITYDDLYVGDAVFAWDAFDKTAEDTLDFGGKTSIVLAGEEGGLQLVLSVGTTAVAKYGNGYLELTDASASWSDTLKIAGVYSVPAYQSALEVNTYSTQMVMSLLEVTEAYAPQKPGAQDAIPFASGSKTVFTTFGITESLSFIAGANVTLFDALSENYLKASRGDQAARDAFRTPIDENTYRYITEGKTATAARFADHVYKVDATDEDPTNDPGFTTYVTGYEADWTVFNGYLTISAEKYYNYSTGADGNTFSAHYPLGIYSQNTSNTPGLFNSGVAKTTVTTSTWALDAEWKTNGKLWSTKDYEAITTQTRVNTVTALAQNQYKSSASFYVDGVAPEKATNSGTYWKDFERTGATAPSADFLVRPQGMNARYYAIRIYNEALTEAQMKQNHFADLCKFYGVDLGKLSTLYGQTDEFKNVILPGLYQECAELSLGETDKDAVEAKVDAAIEKIENAKKAIAFNNMYVEGARFMWNAYASLEGDVVPETLGTYGKGDEAATLTITGGTNAYMNGYLRAVNATLQVNNAYAIPESGKTVSYTTELVYATYLDKNTARNNTNVLFEGQYVPAYATKDAFTVFKTIATNDSQQYGDEQDIAWLKAWNDAYAAANADKSGAEDGARAKFWTPISKIDYDSFNDGENFRKVKSGANANDASVTDNPIGDYSQTGYEANWDGFAEVLKTRSRYYDGYNYTVQNKEGTYNSYILKSGFNCNLTGYLLENDYRSTIGPAGNWTSTDFGEITTHAWVETVAIEGNDATADVFWSNEYTTTGTFSRSGDKSKLVTTFTANKFNADYYAIRIYPFVLTETQRAQNHFADLCSHYDIENVETFISLKDVNKTALYAAFKSISLGETSQEALEEAINDLAEAEAAEKLENELFALYDAMYVQDKLLYRWDAYRTVMVGGGTATLADRNGSSAVLSLSGATYDSTKKYVATTDAFDFSSLITRTNGLYDQKEIEFELVLTHVNTETYTSGSNKYAVRPYLTLGPINGLENRASGGNAYVDADKNIYSHFGGVGSYYLGMPIHPANSVVYYYYIEGDVNAGKLAHYGTVSGATVLDETKTSILSTSYYNKLSAEDKARLESVTVTQYYNKGIEFCTQDWAAPSYYGNTVGEAYAIGGALTFTNPAQGENVGSIDLQLYRDGLKIVKKDGTTEVSYNDIAYVPGKASYVSGFVDPATKAIADERNLTSAWERANFATPDEGIFKIAGDSDARAQTTLTYGYHAFRVYEKNLTNAERMQNHFADLCSYHRIGNAEAYHALSDEAKAALWTQFAYAKIGKMEEAFVNTSFDDESASKDALEKAIQEKYDAEEDERIEAEEQKKDAERLAKYEKLATMYVPGYTSLWTAFGAKEGRTVGTVNLGAALALTVPAEGASAVYSDGYLRAVNSTLTVAGAYERPSNETVKYTTELVYASYLDKSIERAGDTSFNPGSANWPAFAPAQTPNVFVTLGFREAIRFADEQDIEWLQAWSGAYAAAKANKNGEQSTFWTPISEADYDSFNDGVNFRKVKSGANANDASVIDKPIGDYSQTGYEANWAGFAEVLKTRTNYYVGYNYAVNNIAGTYNSYVLKTDINGTAGNWVAQYDVLSSFGASGKWSSADFGEITTHTWMETVSDDGNNNSEADLIYGTKYGMKSIARTASGYGYGKGKTTGLSTDFKADKFNADYYAIRIYPFELTETQRAQNHFADLCGYYGIDNADVFLALSPERKADLYESFDSVLMQDKEKVSKVILEAAIDAAKAKDDAFAEKNVAAEQYVKFEGYSVKKYGNVPGLRSVYSLNRDALASIEGVTVKEIGAIMALAKDRKTEDLTVAWNGEAYVVTLANAANATIFDANGWKDTEENNNVYTATFDGVEKDAFAYTCLFNGESATDADKLQTNLIFRGYVVVEYEGMDFVLYTDMASDTFGPEISMYEASTNEAFAGFDTSKNVVDAVKAAQ